MQNGWPAVDSRPATLLEECGGSMTTYIVRRLLWLVPVIFFVSLITFSLMHMAPGGPWDRDLSARQVDPRTQQLLNAKFGLDKPLFFNTKGGNPLDSQFFNWLWNAARGDLGPSYRQRGMNVQDMLFKPPEGKQFWESRFGYSARLGLLALTLAVVLAFPWALSRR
jgi:oligopeptide transport system permease protein